MDSTVRHFADAGGRPLHARTWDIAASAPPRAAIVLLHDSLGAVALWRDFPSLLCRHTGRRVVAYDRLGFGNSAAHPGRLQRTFIADEARTVLALLDHLDLERAILFGHSVGGGMAISAAAQFPDRIAAVITESAQAFVEDRTLEGIRAAKSNFADPEQLARLARYHGNSPEKAQWVLDAWTETWLSPAFADWSLDEDLRQLRCPLLAMHGDRDQFGSALHPQRIAGLPSACAGRGEYVMFEGCGHVPHREFPERVANTVGDFLQRCFSLGM